MAEKKRRKKNDGTITQLANGKFRVMLSLGLKPDGTRNRPSNVFDTENEAIAWKNKMLATADIYGSESVVVQSDLFVHKFFEWLMNIKRSEVQSRQLVVMLRNYHKHIEPFFRTTRQKDVNQALMQRFFKHLEKQNVGLETRRKMKGWLAQYFELALANTPMRNPTDGVKIETTGKKIETVDLDTLLNPEEYKAIPKEHRQAFLDALDKETQSPYLKPLCYLMYFIGSRIGEVLAYQWKDFNFERRYFFTYKGMTMDYEVDDDGNVVGKGKSVIGSTKTKEGIRPLPLIDILYEVMYEWKERQELLGKINNIHLTEPDDYVFAKANGEFRTEGGTRKTFKRFLKRHNLDGKGIHFHALRQTFSNSLFAQNANEQLITDLMGHADISTTKGHYKSLQKFDSVQEAARKFNEIYKPKNPKYCADQTCQFTPEGYVTENEAILEVAQQTTQEQTSGESLVDILAKLQENFPEVYAALLASKKN